MMVLEGYEGLQLVHPMFKLKVWEEISKVGTFGLSRILNYE